MTQRPSLFRQEALEFQAGQPQGGALRIDPRWIRWSYWIVLVFIVAGVVVASTARTSQTTSGPALVNLRERSFVALVPDAASRNLQRGQLVRLQVHGPGGRSIVGRTVRAAVADQAGVRRAGFARPSQPAILVTGVLAPGADVASLRPSRRREGQAVVVLGSHTLSSLFLRQLHGTFGGGGGS